MKFRVWHIPQVPMKAFYVEGIQSPDEGKMVIDLLASYDLFQYENNIKPDYSNASGLEVLRDDKWVDWEDEDGYQIDDYVMDNGEFVLL